MTTQFDSSGGLRLVLAADARLTTINYTDDQIWELTTGSEPAVLAMQTTYGLRARLMRIFPCYSTEAEVRIDPAHFSNPPVIVRHHPNLCSLQYSPFHGIDVLYDLWVPESQVITARMQMVNTADQPFEFRFEMVAQLTPLKEGQVLIAAHEQVTTILQGRTSQLSPVLFLTGGPEAGGGSYPSLGMDIHLEAGESRTLYWASAALSNPHESFELARRTTARPWEAELSRIELINQASQLDIESGNSQWDQVFKMAQTQALRLLQSPSPKLGEMSFVTTREPDQGYPGGEAGSSYGTLWNGQSGLQALALSQVLLPGCEEIVRGWVRNLLSTVDDRGHVDWKPGLAGQRGRLHAQPVLATLALKSALSEKSERFLAGCYPALSKYLEYWFQPERDKDGDGFPEWEHVFQTGFDEQPLFDIWKPEGSGVDIGTVESPALGAWLYQECTSLMEIARITGNEDGLIRIGELKEKAYAGVQACWDEANGRFSYRDRDLHVFSNPEILYEGKAGHYAFLDIQWDAPKRLQIQVRSDEGPSTPYRMHLSGSNTTQEQKENLKVTENGWSTTQLVYTGLESVEIEGATQGNSLRICTPALDQEDLSLYLPLWAGLATADQAQHMLTHLLENYLSPFGLTQLPKGRINPKISALWNALIVEGMLRYGFEIEAAQVYEGIMNATIAGLHQGPFSQYYDSENGLGIGVRGHAEGLLSLHTYMQLSGVEILTPWKVIVSNCHALQAPFTVKYRGLKYINQNNSSWVVFPDGQRIPIDSPGEYRLINSRGTYSPPNRKESYGRDQE